MSVVIRRAAFEDAEIVAEYAGKLAAQHREYDSERFTLLADREQMAEYYGSQTSAEDAAVLVVELDGKIAGFAYIQFEPRNYADLLESAAWLHDIYVDEAARGHNIGRKLIEASAKAAKELGADKLMLLAATENQFAQELFRQTGFRETMVEMMLSLDGK